AAGGGPGGRASQRRRFAPRLTRRLTGKPAARCAPARGLCASTVPRRLRDATRLRRPTLQCAWAMRARALPRLRPTNPGTTHRTGGGAGGGGGGGGGGGAPVTAVVAELALSGRFGSRAVPVTRPVHAPAGDRVEPPAAPTSSPMSTAADAPGASEPSAQPTTPPLPAGGAAHDPWLAEIEAT